MLGLTAALTLAAPVALPAVALVDLATGRRPLPTARLYLFVLQYAVNDSVEIIAAPAYRRSPGFARRIQLWSLRLLRRRAERLLGMRVEVSGLDELAAGPLVLVSRHVSIFDASLPALVGDDAGLDVRGVIMAELLVDPGFDLLYPHVGSVFIPRDDGPEARRLITGMLDGVAEPARTAVAIFPEGRLYRPEVAERLLHRLTERNPERARRLAALECSLPPRPGGLWALLQTWPDADIAVIDHAGFDGLGPIARLRQRVPLARPITVEVRRIPRAAIPDGYDDYVRWLDDLWLDLDDAAVRTGRGNRPRGSGRPAR